ncbi:MAG: hypothetical protein JRF69_07075 [Deltaproteobacteria bacterium]|nr:hypothetical protein [Deltaproteobacteria bacterium]
MMSKKIGGIELLAGLCLAMIVVAGCTSSRVNLVRAERITVERMASKGHVKIGKVYVYQEEGGLVVSGRVKPKSVNLRPAEGHVDIAVVSPDGQVVETESVAQTPAVGSSQRNISTARKTLRPICNWAPVSQERPAFAEASAFVPFAEFIAAASPVWHYLEFGLRRTRLFFTWSPVPAFCSAL